LTQVGKLGAPVQVNIGDKQINLVGKLRDLASAVIASLPWGLWWVPW
jgi:hypothetical protein